MVCPIWLFYGPREKHNKRSSYDVKTGGILAGYDTRYRRAHLVIMNQKKIIIELEDFC
ncbi:MAG: hypothetical protein AB8U25_01855 [Rickettsiales endosymbiont of Dermacentor nuttalli]